MGKTMYSLMLTQEIVSEIDKLARSRNTNRSSMVNSILAEYVSLKTPEKSISDILGYIESLLKSAVFAPVFEPCARIMSVKSETDYKYRPAVRYAVELYNKPASGAMGELKVVFRTKSERLLVRLENFFDAFARMESEFLQSYFSQSLQYQNGGGKFVRLLNLPADGSYSAKKLAASISNYIKMLDAMIKGCLSAECATLGEMEEAYLRFLSDGDTVII